MRSKIVKIEWSYPRTYDNIFYSPQINDIGLYCLSVKSNKGKEELIYIGKTNHSFYSRLSSHQEWFNLYRGKRLVRLGVIRQPKKYDDELISFVESALILQTGPFENTQSRNSYSYYDDYEYQIINSGYRGILPKTISTKD
ncbi:MAG: hypothetical protein GX825_02830 [Syntrophomonadaceae bacterium]|nr:hypothetical protein [Syntrophomonadaceae bacterium]